MNPGLQNGAKKPAFRRDGAKRVVNIDEIIAREANAFYRDSNPPLSSDSGESSRRNSTSNDSDYHTSVENAQADYCRLKNSRDDIANQLSKLKIGYNKNIKSDSGTMHDLTSEEDLEEAPSIIAGNALNDMNTIHSVHSVADSRFSIILAGRLDSREDLYSRTDERSLLNIAINESVENNEENRSNNDLAPFVDSLEVQREEVSSSGLNERDSLEAGACCARDKPGNPKTQNDLFENNENFNPNASPTKRGGLPRIISNETFYYPVKLQKTPAKAISVGAKSKGYRFVEPASKQKNNSPKGNPNSSDTTNAKFYSLLSDSEQLVIADIKTPNVVGIRFIEDCSKSTPRVEVNADTFGSELISDIANLSALGSAIFEQNEENLEADSRRNEILKRFSHQFALSPAKFTEKLLTLVEESFLANTKPEDPDFSGVNLSRLTEEFRKICRDYGKRIEDESLPEFGFGPSFNVPKSPDLGAGNAAREDVSPFHNFSKLGGGTKVYRKTPRRVLQASNGQCSTPNCANILHKVKNNNLYSPAYQGLPGVHDNTETFEFWENLCYEVSPNKHTRPTSSASQISDICSQEDLLRKSDQLMAALDESQEIELEAKNGEGSRTPKDCRDGGDSMRQKSIAHLSPSLGDGKDKLNCIEIDHHLAQVVEKRKKCFEEARKVFECKGSSDETKNCKSLDKASRFMDKYEASGGLAHQARLVNTLSACVDYFDHFKTLQSHKKSLQCIVECSEASESPKDNQDDSRSPELVEAVINPEPNCAKYTIGRAVSSPKKTNLISQTCLYIPGTPKIAEEKSEGPQRRDRLSPHLLSPRATSPKFLSKKIKSPSSPVRRKSSRAAKPASHSNTPRTPSITPEFRGSGTKKSSESCKSGINSTPRCQSHKKLNSGTNSPGLMDVTNTKNRNEIPKVLLMKASPSSDSQNKSAHLKVPTDNIEADCQKQLHFSESDTPRVKKNKFFHTPGKTPTHVKTRPKIKYFETPKGKPLQKKLPRTSPGSHRVNYNTVQSPVAMYIRGTDPNLITNVKGKSNERMLTSRRDTPKSMSKVSSPILARSPCMSPQPTESSRLKFQLTPARRQEDLLNMALCESDPSSNIGSESSSHSPFPKISYKPAAGIKMIKDSKPQRRCAKVSVRGAEEKMIYRHEGRLKSAAESNAPNYPASGSTTDITSYDLGDISLLQERPVAKTNIFLKK